ncbi:MAG: secretin and TonB N-terminal domain-containing protein [Oligoflexia bacterium]|nr:secretin and TonB N-terminal domain-containing protein [Oligoflexia bacterium]
MKFFKTVLIFLVASTLISCASKGPKPQDLPDVAETSLEGDTQPSADTTEQDLQALNEELAPATNDPQTQNMADEFATPAPNPEEQAQAEGQAPPPELQSEAALAPPEQLAAQPDEKPARITALDFNANDNGGTVNIRTNKEVNFTTRKNDNTNQFIIELNNTTVAAKFKRPYITKEFPGAIASVQAYQAKGADKIVRIVVQLRANVEPAVLQNANTLSVSASGLSPEAQPQEQVAQQEEQTAEPGQQEGETQDTQGATVEDPQIMSNKSFDSFLLGQNKFYGKKISIEVTNQDVKEVFKFISEESGLNIILDDDVTGKVTMKLRKVPWDQALAIILQSKQLGYIRNGSILRVASLRTLKTESLTAREVLDAQKSLQNVRVQVYPISYAKSDELSTQVKDLLTARGKVTADKRTNTIVVADIPEVLSKVKALIAKLDTQTPQVLIEAKIIEARDTFERTLGVNSYTFAPGTATSGSLSVSTGVLDVAGDFSTSLTLLEKENQIKVLSSPKIVALDRVEATIEQTTQFPIRTVVSTASGTSTSTSFQDLKLQLKVKPQITIDGGVIMDLAISRDIQGQSADSVTGAKEVGKRQASTQVLVENGDTIVIGGIYQSDVSEQEGGVPFLKDIPLLGWIFKGTTKNKDKNELVIMLTPKILNREKAFVKAQEAL